MRTAILFTGTSYNFRFSIESLMQNFVLANDADVFILTSKYNMRRRTKAGTIPEASDSEAWHSKSQEMEREESDLTQEDIDFIRSVFGSRLKVLAFIEDMPDYMKYLEGERVKMMDLVNIQRKNFNPAPFGSDVTSTENGNIRCVIDQYNHVKKCFELMEAFEISHEKYDYVCRARIDFICPKPIVFAHYYLNHDKSYLYTFGSYKIDNFEWADEYCFFAKRDIANVLFKSMDRMGLITHDRTKYNTISNNNEFLFCAETQYALLLDELNLPIVNVKIYRTAKYTNSEGYDYMNYMFNINSIAIEDEYKICLDSPTDINEHLPILREYAEKCKHITELGTRFGNSTVAFMAARPKKFITYDVAYNPRIDYLKKIAADNEINFIFKLENPQSIEKTDLLFIDTDHHVEQCSKELGLHAKNVRKYLIFHDVVSFWEKGQGHESGGGLKYAIEPFMQLNPEWKQVYRSEKNNGLLILERC